MRQRTVLLMSAADGDVHGLRDEESALHASALTVRMCTRKCHWPRDNHGLFDDESVRHASPVHKLMRPRTSRRPRENRAFIACIAMQLAACILPSVTQQPEPPTPASSSESATTEPASRTPSDASVSVVPDGATPPVSTQPTPAPDASTSMTEPSASAADGSAGTAGMSSMSAAGQGARASTAGRPANAPSAGESGSAAPALPLALGELCRSAEQCASGRCADGVCCNTTCEGECEECNTRGTEGRCIKLDGVPDFDSCPDSRQICGRGVCRRPNGDVCESSSECASGSCGWAGDCCAIACDMCHACASDGETCEPVSGRACGVDGTCDNGWCMPP